MPVVAAYALTTGVFVFVCGGMVMQVLKLCYETFYVAVCKQNGEAAGYSDTDNKL